MGETMNPNGSPGLAERLKVSAARISAAVRGIFKTDAVNRPTYDAAPQGARSMPLQYQGLRSVLPGSIVHVEVEEQPGVRNPVMSYRTRTDQRTYVFECAADSGMPICLVVPEAANMNDARAWAAAVIAKLNDGLSTSP